jgi:hypothetical protein
MSHITSRHPSDKRAQQPRAPRQRKPLDPGKVSWLCCQINNDLGAIRLKIEKALKAGVGDLSAGGSFRFSESTAQVVAILTAQAMANLETIARLDAEEEAEELAEALDLASAA